MKIYFALGFCLLTLAGCNSYGPHDPATRGDYLSRHYNYAPKQLFNTNEVASSYPASFTAQTPKELMLSTYIWDRDLQVGLGKAIREGIISVPVAWGTPFVNYKFEPTNMSFYSTRTSSLCREGIIKWKFEFADSRWEDLTGLFCKIGPNGEWLPTS